MLSPSTTVLVHQAWKIMWQASDVTSLTPAPPLLSSDCGNVQIQTWIPDATANPIIGRTTECIAHYSSSQSTENDSASDTASTLFFYIGPPIISLFVAGFFLWWCCIRRIKKNKRRRLAAAAAAQQLETERLERSNELSLEPIHHSGPLPQS